MATSASGPAARPTGDAGIFQHLLVGIDETPESLVAGRVELLAVAETYLAVHAGAAVLDADDGLYAGTQRALERARELVEPDDARMLAGRLVDALSGQCARTGVTLVAVGVRPHGRLGTRVFGGHDIEVLHTTPCSILIARPGWGPSRPERILVGVDSTPESRVAEEVGAALAVRLGRELVPVVGLGEDVDLDLLRAERDQALLDPRGLVDALGAAAHPGDLVLVGRPHDRRGRGADLAERVVYGTRCSVLVVRPAAG
jgi:nucleotide-binding universal stress UspA family protein